MTIPNVVLGQKITEGDWNLVADTVNAIDRDGLIPVIEFSTDRTLLLTDRDNLLTLTGSDSRTATIPTNAAVAFPIGSIVAFCQHGTGSLVIAPASGVTIYSESSKYTLRAQYAIAAALKVDTNVWRLMGNLKP
jgi:hypothetical protein